MSDLVNGLFEAIASLFIAMNCVRLYKDKRVQGIWWPTIAFFTLWGFWNLYFYPSVSCWWSFAGGVLVVVMNVTWLILLYKFTRKG